MRKKRVLEEPATEVANSLNELISQELAGRRSASRASQRLLRLIDLCGQYLKEARRVAQMARVQNASFDLARQRKSAFHEITTIIQGYKYHLVVNSVISLDPGSHAAVPGFCYSPDSRRQARLIEWATAPKILEAMHRRQLQGLRRCKYSRCRRWFYSQRRNQKSCPGGRCRERAWSRSAKGRASNRLRQARYYATEAGKRKSLDRQADRREAREKAAREAQSRTIRPM
jgi:hypothetical protein